MCFAVFLLGRGAACAGLVLCANGSGQRVEFGCGGERACGVQPSGCQGEPGKPDSSEPPQDSWTSGGSCIDTPMFKLLDSTVSGRTLIDVPDVLGVPLLAVAVAMLPEPSGPLMPAAARDRHSSASCQRLRTIILRV